MFAWSILLIFSIFVQINAGTFSVDYTTHQFLKDGQPFRYLSGSIHYMRVHPGLWNDRLQRIRALGFNAVQVYVPWNLHEPTEGNFDFTAGLNISNFLTLAQQNNLYVLLRPGPYICAEWEYGGIPYWLIKNPYIKLRTSDQNYTNAVQSYYTALLAQIQPHLYKNGGNILIVQVENEYGALGACDHAYTTWLANLIWSKLGNDVVLYHTDQDNDHAQQCGAVNGTLATIDFGPTSDSNIDGSMNLIAKYNNGGPKVVSEYWVTWFSAWNKPKFYPRVEASVGNIVDNLNHLFFNHNASINIYMIHGGTNFGFMNGAETNGETIITSYDYGAAIKENGDTDDIYQGIYNWVKNNITGWPQQPLPIPANNPVSNYGQVTLTKLGTNLITTLTQIQEPCIQAPNPLSFEQIDHGYGYVLYTTTLIVGGSTLSAPNIRDYGYVFVNNNYQGMIERDAAETLTLTNPANVGDTLRILVENRGRANYWSGSLPTIETKGLPSNVTLNGALLQNWYQCGINLTEASINSLSSNFLNQPNDLTQPQPEKAANQPGVYVGTFNANTITDTFFDSTNWGKGQLFVNGFNVGRYWATRGPQYTLYVPSPVIKAKNTVLLIELNGAQQNYVNFINHTIYH